MKPLLEIPVQSAERITRHARTVCFFLPAQEDVLEEECFITEREAEDRMQYPVRTARELLFPDLL